MAGGGIIAICFVREFHQIGELDRPVAQHAGIGRAAGGVFPDEIRLDGGGESLGDVQHRQGDIQRLAHRLRSHGRRRQGGIVMDEKGHPRHIVSRVQEKPGAETAVHTPAHSEGNTFVFHNDSVKERRGSRRPR